jgi:hypothetical protein
MKGQSHLTAILDGRVIAVDFAFAVEAEIFVGRHGVEERISRQVEPERFENFR